jgi:regulator of replication initiation timing
MSLKNTLDKIKALEAEKKSLLLELDGLKKLADAKANALENEVGALRDEVKTLKSLMGQPELSPSKIQILEPNPKVL